jgi:hypothetical protein
MLFLDDSLLTGLDVEKSDIESVVDDCDRCTKVGFLPEIEASYLGLILHVMDLTSLNSTDNKQTIEALVDKVLTNLIELKIIIITVGLTKYFCLSLNFILSYYFLRSVIY